VTGEGKGLTGRSGTAAVRELADRIGLSAALSAAARPSCPANLLHDPGAVLRDVVVTLVDGDDDFSAIEVLRGQANLLRGDRGVGGRRCPRRGGRSRLGTAVCRH